MTHQNIPYLDKTGRTIFDGLIHSESDNLQTRLRAYVADIIFDFESKLQRTEVSSFEQMAEIFVRCLVEHKLFSLSWTEYIQPDGKKRMVAVDWQTSRVENLLNTFGLYRKNGFKKHYMFLMNILFSGSDPYYDHLREMVRKKGFYVQEVNNFFNRKLLFLQRTNQLEIHHSKLAMSFYNGGIQFFKNREKIDHFCYFPVLDYSRSNPIIGITTGLYRRPQSLEKMESLLKGMPGNQLLTDDQKYLVFRQLGSKIIFPILNHYFEIFWNRHLNQQITVRGSIEQYPHPLLVYNEKGICVDGNGKAFKALGHEQSAHQILNFSFDQQKNDDTVSFEILKQKIKDYYQTQSPKNSESFETTVHFKTKNGKSVKMLVRANINRINQKINSGLFYSFYLENIKEQALTHHYHQIVEENFFRVETPMIFMNAEDGTITEGSYPWLKTIAGLTQDDLANEEYVLFLKSKKRNKLYTNFELGNISAKKSFKRIQGRFDAFIIKKSELRDFLDSQNHWQRAKLLKFIEKRKASASIDAGINSIQSAKGTLELLHVQGKDIAEDYDTLMTSAYSKSFYTKEFKKHFQIYKNSSKRKGFSYLYLDIDNFKAVNDQYGHDAGDKILIEFGKAISRSLRTSDYFFRNGGEEFVIILPGVVSEDQLRRIDARLHEEVGKVVRPDKLPLGFTAGAVILNESSVSFSEPAVVNTLSDMMMYQFKQTRKGLTNIFNILDAAHMRVFNSINSDQETTVIKKLAQ